MSGMKRLVNYSHPLGNKAKKQIKGEIGEFEEIVVHVQFDLEGDLLKQVDDLLDPTADYIIPPAFGAAAYIMGMRNWDLQPVIWLKSDSVGVAPEFVLGGVVGGKRYG